MLTSKSHIVFIFFILVFGRSYGQFLGGNGTGYITVSVVPTSCVASAANPYGGGNGSGSGLVVIIPTSCSAVSANPYAGGNGDGVSLITANPTVCVSVSANPYAGGNGDGVSLITASPTVCVSVSANPYAGGNGDGFIGIQILPTVCNALAANPYAGGIADGYGLVSVVECEPSEEVDLPITLLEFKGNCLEGVVTLNWITASELSNDFFVIEKSNDLKYWESVCKVDGSEFSTNLKSYTCSDFTGNSGVVFYKLSQTDLNGAVTEFEPVEVSACGEAVNEVYFMPNPASSSINIISRTKVSDIKIVNPVGEVLAVKDDLNSYSTIFNIEFLNPGVYYILIKSNPDTYVLKLIKTSGF